LLIEQVIFKKKTTAEDCRAFRTALSSKKLLFFLNKIYKIYYLQTNISLRIEEGFGYGHRH